MAESGQRKLPRSVRLANLAGLGLKAVGLLPLLRQEQLIERAMKKCGLEDFGDEGFREGLGVLLRSLKDEASLNPLGTLMVFSQITESLTTRLQMADFIRRHPQVEQQHIAAPIFIIGLPRTGTTILHGLLSQDPANRAPLSWEVAFPCPPAAGPDTRIAMARERIARSTQWIADLEAMHPVGAELPEECMRIMAYNFTSGQFSNFQVPSYDRWYRQTDLIPTYQFHRTFLQLLSCADQRRVSASSGRPGERWLLKDQMHAWAINEVLAVYPDARFIQTHRDPTKVLPSLASLRHAFKRLVSDSPDPRAEGAALVDAVARQMARAIEVRKSLPNCAGRFYDLQFVDFVRDPLAAVADVYRHFDMELTCDVQRRMREFMARNPRDKHGKHRYTPDMYGMSERQLVDAFKPYCEHFGVQSNQA